jgi:hypothetical protein
MGVAKGAAREPVAAGLAKLVASPSSAVIAWTRRLHLDALAEPVAAAFIIRAASFASRETRTEALRAGERAGVEFGITATEPAAVATLRRRFVRQRRERNDFRTGATPRLQHVFIHEAEGAITGKCDALAGG